MPTAEPFIALTAYGVQIPKALPTREHALEWARQEGQYWPGAKIQQRIKTGWRTIWRHS